MEPISTNSPEQRSVAARADEGGLIQRQGTRLQARLRPLFRVAEGIVNKVRVQAALAALAGLWLWGLLFYPFAAFSRIGIVVLAVGVLLAFLLPAGVLFVFWAGLRQLLSVPDQLLDMAGQGEARTGELLQTVSGKAEPHKMRRLWRFFRTVRDLRTLILDSKGLLLQFTLVLRVANPLFIGVLFIAFVVSLLMIAVAVVMLFVVVF